MATRKGNQAGLRDRAICRAPRALTAENFRRYGVIVAMDGRPAAKNGNFWRIVVRQPRAPGWRIAYLVLCQNKIDCLEQHPDSWESFEPVNGRALLYVCAQQQPRQLDCFLLTKPVVVRKGVWHGVVALDRRVEIKITENNSVGIRYHQLGYQIPDARGKLSSA